MPLSTNEAERAERVLKRTIVKRDSSLSQMQLLHDLAQKVETNEDVLPLFRARKRDVDTLLSQFHAEQDSIFDLLLQLQREEKYYSIHATMGTVISEQYYFIMAIAEVCDVNFRVSINPIVQNNPDCSHIQLPKITLPSFDGDILQWIIFRDTFKSLVHDNTNLKNIEKYHYLLSAVAGSASAIVRSIPLSDSNYSVAWDALNDRFDNSRQIVTAHIDKLFNFPPLRSSSLAELKSFLDTFQEYIAALKNFDIPNKEGYLFIYLASRVLDSDTKCLFESQHKSNMLPIIDDLLKYVQTRCHVLQNSSSVSNLMSPIRSKLTFPTKRVSSTTQTSLFISSFESSKCPICHGSHKLYKCERFLQLPSSNRLKMVQSQRLYTNCLSANHTSSKFTSKYTCRQCSAKHHSLLHLEKNGPKGSSCETSNNFSKQQSSTPSAPSSNSASSVFVDTTSSTNLSVLSTALIRMRDRFGQWIPVRTLIDSGSQISAITHTCVTQLGLTRRQSQITVAGLSQNPVSDIMGITTCRCIPHSATAPEFTYESIILPKLTGPIPSAPLNPCIRSKYLNLQFANPSFDQPGCIEFLLGIDLYNQIFEYGYHVRHTLGLPSAFETKLGWIFVGTAPRDTISLPQTSLSLVAEPSLNQLLHRFWKVEEPVSSPIPFTEEQKCEDLFVRTTVRETSGRYTVTFPFKSDPSILGESLTESLSRFLNLERKHQNDPELYAECRSFMSEYIKLCHMHLAMSSGKYIIPHHAVVKRLNNKLKLRVVFDASAKTSSGLSLNDILFTGQKLQLNITDLLIRCRLSRYMFTADICKMYLQINMKSSDCQYQHILWRNNPSEPLLSEALSSLWNQLALELPLVSAIKIQRHLPVKESSDAQLIGFSDASLKGYSAVVYLRLSYASKPDTVHLLTAKSKVAPLKSGPHNESLTVPRLELCGAMLLAQVLHHVQNIITSSINLSSIHAWTDSTVVLSWLTNPQIQFKVFVTNRLKKIWELILSAQWHHVPTLQNPADCISRGMFPNIRIF